MIKLFRMNENVVQYFYNKAFKNFYIEENSKKILRNIFKKNVIKNFNNLINDNTN